MNPGKKLGIWLNHAHAHLIEFSDEAKATRTISADFDEQDKNETLHRSGSEMHNKQQHKQMAYYKKLSAIIMDFGEVLLLGPTEAKIEFMNYLRKDRLLDGIKIEVLNDLKMSDNQQHDFVTEYFRRFEIKSL